VVQSKLKIKCETEEKMMKKPTQNEKWLKEVNYEIRRNCQESL
jgi:hypothetical protein